MESTEILQLNTSITIIKTLQSCASVSVPDLSSAVASTAHASLSTVHFSTSAPTFSQFSASAMAEEASVTVGPIPEVSVRFRPMTISMVSVPEQMSISTLTETQEAMSISASRGSEPMSIGLSESTESETEPMSIPVSVAASDPMSVCSREFSPLSLFDFQNLLNLSDRAEVLPEASTIHINSSLCAPQPESKCSTSVPHMSSLESEFNNAAEIELSTKPCPVCPSALPPQITVTPERSSSTQVASALHIGSPHTAISSQITVAAPKALASSMPLACSAQPPELTPVKNPERVSSVESDSNWAVEIKSSMQCTACTPQNDSTPPVENQRKVLHGSYSSLAPPVFPVSFQSVENDLLSVEYEAMPPDRAFLITDDSAMAAEQDVVEHVMTPLLEILSPVPAEMAVKSPVENNQVDCLPSLSSFDGAVDAIGGSPGAVGEGDSLSRKIIRQMEVYYFCDFNLMKDNYLREHSDADGWIDLFLIIQFPRMKLLTSNTEVVINALDQSTSGIIEVSDDRKRVRRSPLKPFIEDHDLWKSDLKTRSAVVMGYSRRQTQDEMHKVFEQFGHIDHIERGIRKINTRPGSRYQFDLVDLVIFLRREDLLRFAEQRYTTLREMGIFACCEYCIVCFTILRSNRLTDECVDYYYDKRVLRLYYSRLQPVGGSRPVGEGCGGGKRGGRSIGGGAGERCSVRGTGKGVTRAYRDIRDDDNDDSDWGAGGEGRGGWDGSWRKGDSRVVGRGVGGGRSYAAKVMGDRRLGGGRELVEEICKHGGRCVEGDNWRFGGDEGIRWKGVVREEEGDQWKADVGIEREGRRPRNVFDRNQLMAIRSSLQATVRQDGDDQPMIAQFGGEVHCSSDVLREISLAYRKHRNLNHGPGARHSNDLNNNINYNNKDNTSNISERPDDKSDPSDDGEEDTDKDDDDGSDAEGFQADGRHTTTAFISDFVRSASPVPSSDKTSHAATMTVCTAQATDFLQHVLSSGYAEEPMGVFDNSKSEKRQGGDGVERGELPRRTIVQGGEDAQRIRHLPHQYEDDIILEEECEE